MMKNLFKYLLPVLCLFALPAHALVRPNPPAVPTPPQVGVHFAQLSWTTGSGGVDANGNPLAILGFTVYRGNTAGGPYVPLAAPPSPTTPGLLPCCSYSDGTVLAGGTYYYVVSETNSQMVPSGYSNEVSATIPGTLPPPTCTTIAVGCRISVKATANIRQTPTSSSTLPAMYCSSCAPAGSTGTIVAISPYGYAPYGITNWVQVKFDTCVAAIPNCTGWMGSDNMTLLNVVPVVSISITPTTATVQVGQSQTFVAAVKGATDTSVTWSSNAPGGLFASSVAGTFLVNATSNADSTKSATATVTVKAPLPTLGATVSGLTITLVPANIPSGTAFTGSVTSGGKTATFSGTIP